MAIYCIFAITYFITIYIYNHIEFIYIYIYTYIPEISPSHVIYQPHGKDTNHGKAHVRYRFPTLPQAAWEEFGPGTRGGWGLDGGQVDKKQEGDVLPLGVA